MANGLAKTWSGPLETNALLARCTLSCADCVAAPRCSPPARSRSSSNRFHRRRCSLLAIKVVNTGACGLGAPACWRWRYHHLSPLMVLTRLPPLRFSTCTLCSPRCTVVGRLSAWRSPSAMKSRWQARQRPESCCRRRW